MTKMVEKNAAKWAGKSVFRVGLICISEKLDCVDTLNQRLENGFLQFGTDNILRYLVATCFILLKF